MSRYCIYIDGFNVYYALQQPSYRKYKWLNYRKLAESVIGNNDLKAEADFRIKMPQKLLQACQFPEQIKIGNKIIKRPESWR